MARLVNTLVKANNAHLFAVGDDWQAIYGFAGGDVDHVVNFESHFGPASRTMLDTNYRSPATIVEAGGTLNFFKPRPKTKKDVFFMPRPGQGLLSQIPHYHFVRLNK